jgi:hypothetical protein
MKERGILMIAPMVRALLAGTKTQTRRALKQVQVRSAAMPEPEWRSVHTLCPYGQPGDRLWGRETWCDWCPLWNGAWCGHGTTEGMAKDHEVYFAADDPATWKRGRPSKWRPSIFMPRWASRITLVITGVRVERLQDITRGDAMAEGCPFANMARGEDPRVWYEHLWCDLNGPGSWDANPWVWCLTFRRIEP